MSKGISRRYVEKRWNNFLSQNKRGVILVEGTPVTEIAEKYGTPVYVFVESEIRKRMQRMKTAFPYPKLEIHLAGKTNSNLEILRIAREEGLHLDASSIGEIILGLLADFKASDITFTNLNKTEQDIMFAAKVGVQAITVDSYQELQKVERVGKALKRKIRTFIRINPIIDLGKYTTRKHQYGIPHAYARRSIDYAVQAKHIDLIGLHFHGSYINNPRVYILAAQKLLRLARYSMSLGNPLKYIDLGGGFPYETSQRKVFQPEDMGEKFVKEFNRLIAKEKIPAPILIFEPGKFITGNAGIGLVKVVSKKQLPKQKVAITDGSTYAFLPDVIVYHAYYDVLPATSMNQRRTRVYNISGCTCDSIDMLARNRYLPKLEEGDLLAFMDCGAYSTVFASNFNSLKRAPMVLARSDGSMKLIKRRDRYAEMFAPELDILKVADPKELLSLYHLQAKVDKLWRENSNGKKKKTKKKKTKSKRKVKKK